jgi:hypothetical protein
MLHNKMKILIACEYSGIVRDAFIKRGHDAMSCDLLPSERPGPHYQGDVLDIINDGWDMMIAFDPCTYQCNSGVRWLTNNQERLNELKKSCELTKRLLNASISKICRENPIPHKYALKLIGRKYDQIIQPWQFGHGETKATCLWLKNLSLLQPTNIVEGREQRIWKMPPEPDRAKERSRTFSGIANAMAEQWG